MIVDFFDNERSLIFFAFLVFSHPIDAFNELGDEDNGL